MGGKIDLSSRQVVKKGLIGMSNEILWAITRAITRASDSNFPETVQSLPLERDGLGLSAHFVLGLRFKSRVRKGHPRLPPLKIWNGGPSRVLEV